MNAFNASAASGGLSWQIGYLTVLGLAAGLLLTAPARADEANEAGNLDKQIEMLDNGARKQGPTNPTLEAISRKVDVPVAELKRQQARTQMGPGSLFIANALAKRTGRSFDELVAARKSGKGWGQIAKENSVPLGHIIRETRQLRPVPAAKPAKPSESVNGKRPK